MPINIPPSSAYTVIAFREQRHGHHLGSATVRTPSGAVRQIAVYNDHGSIYFDADDGETFSIGALWAATQTALRAGLRAVAPEVFVELDGVADGAAAP